MAKESCQNDYQQFSEIIVQVGTKEATPEVLQSTDWDTRAWQREQKLLGLYDSLICKDDICNKCYTSPFHPLPHNTTFWHTKAFIAVETFVRKGEIACNKQFFLFSQCFLPYMELIFHFNELQSVVCNLFQFGPV